MGGVYIYIQPQVSPARGCPALLLCQGVSPKSWGETNWILWWWWSICKCHIVNEPCTILVVVEHELSTITTWREGKVLRHMPMVEMMTRLMEKREMILAGKEEWGFSRRSHNPLEKKKHWQAPCKMENGYGMEMVEMMTRPMEKREMILAGKEEWGFSSKSHNPLGNKSSKLIG